MVCVCMIMGNYNSNNNDIIYFVLILDSHIIESDYQLFIIFIINIIN